MRSDAHSSSIHRTAIIHQLRNQSLELCLIHRVVNLKWPISDCSNCSLAFCSSLCFEVRFLRARRRHVNPCGKYQPFFAFASWFSLCVMTFFYWKCPTKSINGRIFIIGDYLVKIWTRVLSLVKSCFFTHGVQLRRRKFVSLHRQLPSVAAC